MLISELWPPNPSKLQSVIGSLSGVHYKYINQIINKYTDDKSILPNKPRL